MAFLRFRRKNTHGMTGGKLKFGQNIKKMNCCGSPPPKKKQFSLQVCVCFRPFFKGENDHRQKYVCVFVNTHTDCTLLHPAFWQSMCVLFFAIKTHTDCTNTHILLPIVVFALKTGTKTHTYLERKSIFVGGGLPQHFRLLRFWRTPGTPDTVKYNTFGTPGQTHTRIAHKHTHGLHTNTHTDTHTHIGPLK